MSDSISYAAGDRRSRAGGWGTLRRITLYGGVTLLVIALVLAMVFCYRRPWIWYGSRDAYLRHEMLTFDMPSNRVVYEEEPTKAARLLALPADRAVARLDVQLMPPSMFASTTTDYRTSSTPYDEAEYAIYVPMFYARFWREITIPPGLTFLHKRTGSTGHERLVIVTGGRTYPNRPNLKPSEVNVRTAVWISARSIPSSETLKVNRGTPSLGVKLEIPLRPEQVMRLYGGQADPKDGARFTLRYEIDDVPGTIEGKLQADDTVTLRIVNGPAATQAARPPEPGG